MNNIEKSRGNLLLEFFSEEIPARMQLNSETQLQNLFNKSLRQRDIAFDSFKTYSGPRHLSIIIKNIELEQKDQEIEKRKKDWKPRKTNHNSGSIWKYSQTVGPAYEGAVTQPGAKDETHTYADI